MEANDYQVVGYHHVRLGYQTWDFICDIGAHYLIGSAISCITRHRTKAGEIDLRQAAHYLNKCQDRGIENQVPSGGMPLIQYKKFLSAYVSQLHVKDAEIVRSIMHNNFSQAQRLISDLIAP